MIGTVERIELDRALSELRLLAGQTFEDGSEAVNYVAATSGLSPSTIALVARGDMTILTLDVVVKLAAHWGLEIPLKQLRRLAR